MASRVALALAVLLLAPLLAPLVVAEPVEVRLVEYLPGFYVLQEPLDAGEVEAVVVFESSVWRVYGYTVELADEERCLEGLAGPQQWDFWVVEDFPDDYPVAHVNDSLAAPLRPEFEEGGVLGERLSWVVVLRSGLDYYCAGWRYGGVLYMYTNLSVPDAGNVTLRIRAAQVGGWSSVDEQQYDSYLIVRVVAADGRELNKTYLLGDDNLTGWVTLSIDLSPFAGETVTLYLEPRAGGWVRACEGCTGEWDREWVGIDWVELEADGSVVWREDFQLAVTPPPGERNIVTGAGQETTTTTTTVATPPATTTTTPPAGTTTTTTTPPAHYTTTTTTRPEATETTTTTTTTTTTGEAPSLPVPLRDGDRLVYKIDFYAKGPEGEGSAKGKITLEARITQDALELQAVDTDLPVDTSLASLVFGDTTDLALLIAEAASAKALGTQPPLGSQVYPLPGLDMPYTCPIIKPGAQGTVEGSKESLIPGVQVQYKCTYDKGILVEAHLSMSGEYQGQEIEARLDASLVETTVEGLATGGGAAEGGGLNTTLIMAAVVGVVVVAAVAVFLLRRR